MAAQARRAGLHRFSFVIRIVELNRSSGSGTLLKKFLVPGE